MDALAARGLAIASLAAVLLGCGEASDVDEGPEPAPGGDANLALFETRGNAVYSLATASTGGDLSRIVGDGDAPTPLLFTPVTPSPDGTRLLFAAFTADSEVNGFDGGELFTSNLDGSGLKQLTDLGDALAPIWSPGGETIVFSRVREGGGPDAALFSIPAGGGEAEALTDFHDLTLDLAGSFSPDGETLAFTRTVFSSGPKGIVSDNSIMVPGRDGGQPRPLIENASDPAFSPNGERLAYRDERDGNGKLTYGEALTVAGELYVADAEGSEPRRLTRTRDLNEASPAWSADGRRLAYQRGVEVDNAEAISIRQINPDGSCDRDLLSDDPRGAWYASPSWLGGPKGPLGCRKSRSEPKAIG